MSEPKWGTSRKLIRHYATKVGCSVEDLALDILQFMMDDDPELEKSMVETLEDMSNPPE